MKRSFFENSLEVLTCIHMGISTPEDICTLVEIGDAYYEKVKESQIEWGLVRLDEHQLRLTNRGKNILEYYHEKEIRKSRTILSRS